MIGCLYNDITQLEPIPVNLVCNKGLGDQNLTLFLWLLSNCIMQHFPTTWAHYGISFIFSLSGIQWPALDVVVE